ncbi:MAG: hypothetical protein SPI12_06085 [Actinomycetaceae bacterium]|nr:hypothetical protein [Actinomycetaceae bacterium]MDY6083405.1 hypothetical protein [Actinomycetaceae bacterium]
MVQVKKNLRIFWRDDNTLQIGFSPQAAVVLTGLSKHEQDLVSQLTHRHDAEQLKSWASRHGISQARLESILRMLRLADVLDVDDSGSAHTAHTHARTGRTDATSSGAPHARRTFSDSCIEFPHLDALAVATILQLASVGIRSFALTDHTLVGSNDHPILARAWHGIRRSAALTTILRAMDPRFVFPSHGDIAVVTAPYTVNPRRTAPFISHDIPHLIASTQETTVEVGPLIIPGTSPCALCVSESRAQTAESWLLLAAQADLAADLAPVPSLVVLGSSAAAYIVSSFLESGKNLCPASSIILEGDESQPYGFSVSAVALTQQPECPCTRLGSPHEDISPRDRTGDRINHKI